MSIEKTAKSLSEIEVKTLKALARESLSVKEIAEKAGIPIDSVRRALGWLSGKGLVSVGKAQSMVVLSKRGTEAIEKGIPARQLARAIESHGGKVSLQEAMAKSGMQKSEFNAALGTAKKMNWVVFNKGRIELTGLEKEELGVEKVLGRIAGLVGKTRGNEIPASELSEEEIGELKKNGLARKKIIEMAPTTRAKTSTLGLKALEVALGLKARSYNVAGEVPALHIGKKQPYVRFLEQIRRKLVAMGFTEMDSPYIVQEFYNFDVLFQPQNHPARDWTNTYQLKKPRLGKLPGAKYVKAVKEAHEFGAGTGSKGWGYEWSESIARKLMPAAHGTAHSARQLVKGVKVPGKYFSIARCYRPDTIDRTHLIEFNQLEGIIVGNFSFKHLLGMLKEFAEEIAHAKKVKFFPDYYPFTEPSVQLSALHPELGWVEFGGAGMFRPEMLEPLGIKEQVLAWGLGIDRLAMFKLGISDARELFSQKLDWLRREKLVVLE